MPINDGGGVGVPKERNTLPVGISAGAAWTGAAAPALAEYVTPWGNGCVIAAGGRPVEILLPEGAEGARAAVAEKGVPVEGDVQVASLWAARLTDFFEGHGASWRGEEVMVAEWLDRPPESFVVRVYEALVRIPAGSVVSYGELAAMAGSPRAARAVGTAMARNPFAILVPCHRVVRSNGDIGEYGGGRVWKERLLGFEGAVP